MRLQNDEGGWAEGQTAICEVVKDYFSSLFAVENVQQDRVNFLSSVSQVITHVQNGELTKEFHFEEFTTAIKQMHGDKAPGPDGFNPAFYHKNWGIVGKDIFDASRFWLNTGSFPDGLNHTTVVLIPKCDTPQSMKDLRPISLCNVVYKILSKVLCNRLKNVLPHLVDKAQSAFVTGRSIHDNILIAFETIHMIKNKRRGRVGDVALKIDISKAYDRVVWSYLRDILVRMGFSNVWVRWMRQCVESVSYSFLVNGELVGPINPSRGLRQGDPLSPYLFILCAEGLSAAINHSASLGNIHSSKVSRHAPEISHLLFADDCLLFCKATREECEHLKTILDSYELVSGQAINYNKSGVFFSKNVSEERRLEICGVLGVSSPLNTGRYLGLPSLIGRGKKQVFNYIKERLWKKLQGWRTKHLSRAGKEVLLKSIAQAIPSFCMSTFLIPSTLLDELHRMMNTFWWGGGGADSKGIKWLEWKKMCIPKVAGGRGFRDFHLLNVAFLGKIAWRLLNDPSALMCRVMKARYYPHSSFLEASLGHCPSFSWRGIMEAQGLLRRGLRWKVGDGSNIPVWGEPWLKDEGSFYIQTQRVPELQNLKVQELIIPGTRIWNASLISQVFSPRDVQAILHTPLSPHGFGDRMVWHHSKDGSYSVKSGYRLADTLTRVEEHICEGDWREIWRIKVPPRTKDFMWRLCRNVLPTRDNLLRKRMEVPSNCVLCGNGIETSWHLFFNCPFAADCWGTARLLDKVEGFMPNIESTSELVCMLMKDLTMQEREAAAMIMNQIWFERNSQVWEGKHRSPGMTVAEAKGVLREWQQCRAPSSARNEPTCKKWHKPKPNTFKVNVDAAFFEDSMETGVGMVLRDDHGDFVAARTIRFSGLFEVDIGEAMGFLEALSWVKDLGLPNVEVEGDLKLVIDAIRSSSIRISTLGDITRSCAILCDSIDNCSISYVKRDANNLAHAFARASRFYESPFLWDESPAFVEDLPLVVCNCGRE